MCFGALVLEGYSQVVAAIQLFADNARAKRITVQANHQIQHGGAVVRLDGAVVFARAQDLLGKVERAVVALLKGEARVVGQLVERNERQLRKRVALPQINVGLALDELVEREVACVEQALDDLAVEVAQVEDADITLERRHVLDDFPGTGFADGKLVLVGIEQLNCFDKALDREGVVLRGDGKLLFALARLAVLVHDDFVMVVQLARVGDEFLALVGERDAAAGAVEDEDVHLVFEVADGGREGRLRDIELLGGLVEGAGLCDSDGVT